MTKPLDTFTFRQIGGMWRDISKDAGVLADVLATWELEFDYRIQFARVYDYERGILFMYRASAGKITLELWNIG